jgi:hypothetical protein
MPDLRMLQAGYVAQAFRIGLALDVDHAPRGSQLGSHGN